MAEREDDWVMGGLAAQDIYGDEPPRRGTPITVYKEPPPAAPQAEMRSYTPSWAERIKGGASDALSALGMSRYNANKFGDVVRTGAEFFPPTGIPLAVNEMQRAGDEGKPLDVGIAALGAIPGVGPAAKGAAKGARAAAKAAKSEKLTGFVDEAKMGELADLSRYDVPAPERIKPGDTRVSTRFPTAVKATEDPLTQQLNIGAREMRASPGYEHNIGLLQEYPGFAKLKGMSTDEAAEAYVRQAADNMKYLYERSPQVMKERSPLWYEGAHEISGALANRWDVPRPAASGALASLSPQMDWFKNASLGERTGDIMTSAAAGRILTPEMAGFANAAEFIKKPENAELYRSIAGKSLDQLETPLQKSLWIRLYDEAHNPRAYRTITPEGRFGPYVLNQDGTPAKVGWGALGEIEKAVRSLESGGDPRIISPVLGTKHKVRSFYNNIENPMDTRFGDVTGDTHQVAAGQMRPLSGSSPAVAHSLASGLPKAKQPEGYRAPLSSSITGVQGTYGLIADATRRMAGETGMIPRAGQSSTWEPVRELFPAKFKTAKNAEAVDDIWRLHDRGTITAAEARSRIFDLAGGIGEPSWARPGLKTSAPTRGSTYR